MRIFRHFVTSATLWPAIFLVAATAGFTAYAFPAIAASPTPSSAAPEKRAAPPETRQEYFPERTDTNTEMIPLEDPLIDRAEPKR